MMLIFIILFFSFICIEFIYVYFNGIEPDSLCGFLNGGCNREYGSEAVNTLWLSLIFLGIYLSPIIIIFIILFILVYLKRKQYKNLIHR